MRTQQKEKSESMHSRRKQPIRITAHMRKLRQVSPRFFDNKKQLLERFKILGLEDEDNWTQSQGEGISYVQLLKIQIYNDSDQLPENMIKNKTKDVYEEQPISWDKYFDAIQKNNEVGFVSKYSKPNLKQGKQQQTPKAQNSDMYNDGKIEWDQEKEAEKESDQGTPKKYKMQFKEITENEKHMIMTRIQKDEISVNSKPSLKKKYLSEDSNQMPPKEEKFFGEKVENEFSICKENKDAFLNEETKETQEPEIDSSKITKIEDIESNIQAPQEVIKESISQNQPQTNILSAEDLDRKQLDNIPHQEPEEEFEEEEEEEENSYPTPLNKNSNPLFVPKSDISMSSQQLPTPPNPATMTEFQDYVQNQNEIQTQHMIEQLNQEEIKKTIMQNPNAMYQYQQEMLYNEMSQNIKNLAPEPETNPFELILRDNPTSQWLYKDPQGFVRGPFSCFDMYTWHNEGYFSEDLELSLDGTNFFRLCDLRAVSQRNNTPQGTFDNSPGVAQPMPGYGEVPPQFIPQNPQMHGYGQQMPQNYGGHPNIMTHQMGYQPQEQTPDFEQDYPNGYYSPMNPMSGQGYNPYPGHY